MLRRHLLRAKHLENLLETCKQKWCAYEPKPFVRQLSDFLKTVDEDKYHCFKG
ncbi:DUF3024 domain-containing protein [Pedobacter superstes]|uniref:DUF3024 domain-containing protein n=1 Tax=Pedobacter superstes TaxID=3133441 RepID=UPI003D7275E6